MVVVPNRIHRVRACDFVCIRYPVRIHFRQGKWFVRELNIRWLDVHSVDLELELEVRDAASTPKLATSWVQSRGPPGHSGEYIDPSHSGGLLKLEVRPSNCAGVGPTATRSGDTVESIRASVGLFVGPEFVLLIIGSAARKCGRRLRPFGLHHRDLGQDALAHHFAELHISHTIDSIERNPQLRVSDRVVEMGWAEGGGGG